jgi:hypothetical protein
MATNKQSVLFVNGFIDETIGGTSNYSRQVMLEFADVQDILHESDFSLLAPLFDACYERIKKNIKATKKLSILYFAGHGDADGVYIRNRRPQMKDTETPAKLNAELIHQALRRDNKGAVDLILFNCCNSKPTADWITILGTARVAIGWDSAPQGHVARTFAKVFFSRLVTKSPWGDHAIKDAFEGAKEEIDSKYALQIFFRPRKSFDVTVELCKKTLETNRSPLSKSLANFLKLRDTSSTEDIAKELLDGGTSKLPAIAKFTRFLSNLPLNSTDNSKKFIERLRIIKDLAYTKSLPDEDLATISASLGTLVESDPSRDYRKVVLPAKMTLDQIQLILRQAHVNLKNLPEDAIKEFEWYYNHSLDKDDISHLFEDKLILLNCSESQEKKMNLTKCELLAIAESLKIYPEAVRKVANRDLDFEAIYDFFCSARNTIAVLVSQHQVQQWTEFFEKFPKIKPVVRPSNEVHRYVELDKYNSKANERLRRLRSNQ